MIDINPSIFDNKLKRNGFSLLSALVAVAIGSMAIVLANKTLAFSLNSRALAEQYDEYASLKKALSTGVACKETFAQSNVCDQESVRVLRILPNGSTAELISPDGTKFGKLTARAKCTASRNGLLVQAVPLRIDADSSNGSAPEILPNPLTGQYQGWDSTRAQIFGDGIELCANRVDLKPKVASFKVYFNVWNDGREYIEVDLTKPAGPEILSRNESWLIDSQTRTRTLSPAAIQRSSTFLGSGMMHAMWGLTGTKVKQVYNNAMGIPRLRLTYPGPGKVRISLAPNNHVGQTISGEKICRTRTTTTSSAGTSVTDEYRAWECAFTSNNRQTQGCTFEGSQNTTSTSTCWETPRTVRTVAQGNPWGFITAEVTLQQTF